MPYPAVLTDRDAHLVGSNGAASALFAGAAPWLLEAPVNLPRLLLHPDGIAPRIGNLTEWGWHVIDGLTRKADRNGNRALRGADRGTDRIRPSQAAARPAGASSASRSHCACGPASKTSRS